jgi:hypothetical protein
MWRINHSLPNKMVFGGNNFESISTMRPPHYARIFHMPAFHHRIPMVLANDRSERSVATHLFSILTSFRGNYEKAAVLCVLD